MKNILLVEDDLAVSYVFRRYLDAAGFRVLMADNGRDALALRARQPGLPAMMVSAFGHELKTTIPGVRVLAKPIMGDQLVAELHNLLLDAATVALNRPAG